MYDFSWDAKFCLIYLCRKHGRWQGRVVPLGSSVGSTEQPADWPRWPQEADDRLEEPGARRISLQVSTTSYSHAPPALKWAPHLTPSPLPHIPTPTPLMPRLLRRRLTVTDSDAVENSTFANVTVTKGKQKQAEQDELINPSTHNIAQTV